MAEDRPFEIVILVYPGGTLLDFAGPSEVFHRLPDMRVRFASLDGGPVKLEFGIGFGPTERLADIDRADLILVPGGPDLTAPMRPDWQTEIRRLAEGARHVTSVCTGSLILAAAGVLDGRRSACHWACLKLLAEYGAIPDAARIVEDDGGRFISGGGVTSGIDFALYVAERLRGRPAAEFAQIMIEYDPAPPTGAGHPRSASPELLATLDAAIPGATDGRLRIPGVA